MKKRKERLLVFEFEFILTYSFSQALGDEAMQKHAKQQRLVYFDAK